MEDDANAVLVLRADQVEHAFIDDEMRRLQELRRHDRIMDVLILVEHPEIITAGRRAQRDGMVAPPGYSLRSVDRGGGLTWHGPGQLTVYPIFHWRLAGERSIPGVIRRLEEWILRSLGSLGIEGQRDPRMAGVWIAGRKVASIGLSFSHWVTRHGLTINLDTPPGRVEALAGCGLAPATTTSVAAVTGRRIARATLEAALLAELPAVLGRTVARTVEGLTDPPWCIEALE